MSTDSSRVPRDGVCIECLCLLLGRGAVEGKTRLPFVGSALVLLWERRMRRFWCPCGSHSLEGASAVRTGYTVRCIAATRYLPSPGLSVVPYAQKCCRQLDGKGATVSSNPPGAPPLPSPPRWRLFTSISVYAVFANLYLHCGLAFLPVLLAKGICRIADYADRWGV